MVGLLICPPDGSIWLMESNSVLASLNVVKIFLQSQFIEAVKICQLTQTQAGDIDALYPCQAFYNLIKLCSII